MIKVAMLSGWHVHAKGYARQANSIDGVQVAAVWDENPERGETWAEELSVPFYADLDAVLALEDIDGVIVDTPTNMHREVMVKAAKAGKHIFTEKVLALTLEDCHAIADAVREAGVKFAISFPHRTMPRMLFAKQVVESGVLGQVTLLRIRNAHNGASAGWLPPHFYDPETTGGGALMDLGAHGMYLTHWMLGMPESISASLTNVTGHEVEDNAVTMMKYADGAIAIQETGFVSSQSPFSLEIFGTEGSLLIGGPKETIMFGTNGSGHEGIPGWVVPARLPEASASAMQQWIDGIRSDAPIMFGLEEGIVLTELMVGAYKAHETGAWVKFPVK